jgi:hypothetical protein
MQGEISAASNGKIYAYLLEQGEAGSSVAWQIVNNLNIAGLLIIDFDSG